MPAESQAQQQTAGIALDAKRKGKKLPKSTPAGQMQKMNVSDLKKFAGTKHEGLPKRKVKKRH